MKGKEKSEKTNLDKIILAACIVGIVIVVIMVATNKEDRYSVVYLKSYSNYVKDNVSFTYVVESHEGKPSSYDVEIWLSNSTIQNDSFRIESGSIERSVSFPLQNGTQFPAKVEVIATVNSRNYSVHFWLQGFEGG